MERKSQEENEEMTRRAWSTSTASPREQRLFRLWFHKSRKNRLLLLQATQYQSERWSHTCALAYFTRSTVSFLNPKSVINRALRQKSTQAIVSPLSYWQTRGEKNRKSPFSCFSVSRTQNRLTLVLAWHVNYARENTSLKCYIVRRASPSRFAFHLFHVWFLTQLFQLLSHPHCNFSFFSRKAPILKSHVYKTSCDFRYRCTFSDKTCTFALSFKHIRNPCGKNCAEIAFSLLNTQSIWNCNLSSRKIALKSATKIVQKSHVKNLPLLRIINQTSANLLQRGKTKQKRCLCSALSVYTKRNSSWRVSIKYTVDPEGRERMTLAQTDENSEACRRLFLS